MSLQICCRCRFRRASSSVLPLLPTVSSVKPLRASFSTTAAAHANPTKASGKQQMPGGPPKRGQKTTYSVKKKRPPPESKGKAPAPGERKAMRKRIVLSNTNAVPVEMQDLQADNLSSPELRSNIVGIPGSTVDQLLAMEAFKPTQSWPLFRKPGTLYRSETLDLASIFSDTEEGKAVQKVTRRVVDGERGSGKSVYLLQAMAMAFLKDWVVIHIPEAQDLVNSHTEYGPVPGITPVLYHHQTYTASLLHRIATANPRLASMTVTLEHNLPVTIQSNFSLSRLCEIGSSDPTVSYPIFNAVVAELLAPSRPPLLISLDGLQHIMKHTEYMSPAFTRIHAHDFHLIRWFLSHLGGEAALPNGGAVLAATTESNAPKVPTLAFRLKQMEAQQAIAAGTLSLQQPERALPFLLATGQEPSLVPQPDPYLGYDRRVLDVFGASATTHSKPGLVDDEARRTLVAGNRVEVLRLQGMSKGEARALMEYWALSGMLRHKITERFVGEKWTISGGGVVGELERGCVGTRL